VRAPDEEEEARVVLSAVLNDNCWSDRSSAVIARMRGSSSALRSDWATRGGNAVVRKEEEGGFYQPVSPLTISPVLPSGSLQRREQTQRTRVAKGVARCSVLDSMQKAAEGLPPKDLARLSLRSGCSASFPPEVD
jgi:hypothetical protein